MRLVRESCSMRMAFGICALLLVLACASKTRPPEGPPITSITSGSDTLTSKGGLLTLIDGKRMTSQSQMGPDDIGDVELFKPPTSGDIFGPEAAGGLMRITTKSHALPKSAATCGERPARNPYFEFQVQKPAIYLENEINFPHPTTVNTGLIVQFVVDTMGRPDARSFKVLRTPDQPAAMSAMKSFQGWRFIPAIIDGCRVEQLFQTPVTR